MYFNSPLDLWVVNSAAAGAVQASASKAAGIAGLRHVAKRALIALSATGTVQPAIAVNLRDGATGAGTILVSWAVAACVNTGGATGSVCAVVIDADNLNLPGTAATAMTLEYAGAAAAATQTNCTLIGYDIGGAAPARVPPYTS